MSRASFAVVACLAAIPAAAADPDAGAALAEQCASCHGASGISVEDTIPNLAAQKQPYLVSQLEAFRAGDRENDLMTAIAGQLSDEDIANLAAHFAGLPGAEPGEVVADPAGLAGTVPPFPEGYRDSFVRYYTRNVEDSQQVRHYWTNRQTLDALAAGEAPPDGAYVLVEIFKAATNDAGQPITGEDGNFEEGELTTFLAMAKSDGWGDDVPELLRNGDWRHAVFTADHAHKAGINEARCLACHKPLDDDEYLFRYDELKAAAEG